MPPEPFFAGPGLDRADAMRGQPDGLARLQQDPAARELVWTDGLPAIDEHGRLQWQPLVKPDLFLGLADGAPRYSPALPFEGDLRARFKALAHLSAEEAPLFAAALSLSSWHRRHRFCANCGSPSHVVRGGWSRQCPTCSAEHYPRVDPVVIMLAEHDDRLLLGRQPQYPPNRYSALAGFLEVGETIEAAVARELFEEAGVIVSDIRYVASQPWPFPSSLMIGCTAKALDDQLTIDTTELEDARWFTRSEVAATLAGEQPAAFIAPPHFAIARTLLEHWLSS